MTYIIAYFFGFVTPILKKSPQNRDSAEFHQKNAQETVRLFVQHHDFEKSLQYRSVSVVI